ncbi:MAG: D-xylose transporter XylE [Pseudomonadota bacterium]
MSQANRQIYLITIIAALGGLLFGYDTAVISGAVSAIDVNFVEPRGLSADQAAWLKGFIVASALIGTIFGSAIAGAFAQRMGRRNTMRLAALFFMLSALGSAFPEFGLYPIGTLGAGSTAAFIIYRIIGGFGIGLASVVCPMYIAEIAPSHLRGRLVSLYQFAIVTGIFGVYFINYGIASLGDSAWIDSWGWRYMLASESVFALAFLVSLAAVPESPRWLVMRARAQDALNVLTRYESADRADAILHDIRQSLDTSDRRSVLHFGMAVIIIGVMLSVFQQFVGINAVLYYAPSIFESLGASTNASFLQAAIVGSVNFAFTLIAYRYVDRAGRKPLLLAGAALMAVAMLSLGTCFYLVELGLFALVVMMVYVAAFALSWGPVVWVVLSEMFPNSIRAKALPIAVAAQWISNFLVTSSFTTMTENRWLVDTFNNGFAYWFYGVVSAFAFVFVLRFVPETKGMSLEAVEGSWSRSRR